MKLFKLPENPRFTNKALLIFLIPILFEQLMLSGLGIADTFMLSFLGEDTVAGVALVNRIDNFAKQFFLALAQGGSVLLSMYIGAKDPDQARESLKTNIRIVVSIGIAVMALMLIFKTQILSLLFGNAEPRVLEISGVYFSYTALSYPFIAVYYAGTASFRAMGESRVPSIASIVMMCINLLFKFIFIFLCDLGVIGAALSTVIAMGVVGFTLIAMLHRKKNKVVLHGLFRFDFNPGIAKRILGISLPNGIEQGMFQLGALLIAGLISGLGTAAIAADQIARNISPLIHAIGAAFNAVMMMVVGQCMGAGKPDEASMYIKHLLKMQYTMTIADVGIFLLALRPITSIFQVSAEAQGLAVAIMTLYGIGSCFFYPTSFASASALRGAGDTKFVMFIASASMLLFRVGAAYIFVNVFHMGVIGAWVAMVSDWVIRSIVFNFRLIRGKWKLKKCI